MVGRTEGGTARLLDPLKEAPTAPRLTTGHDKCEAAADDENHQLSQLAYHSPSGGLGRGWDRGEAVYPPPGRDPSGWCPVPLRGQVV